MIDDSQMPGAGPGGAGEDSNPGGTGGDWSTVPPAQPPPGETQPESLEPLPPPPQEPPPQPGSYQQVYGAQPGGTYPPPPPGYSGGPQPQYPPPPPPASAGQGLSSNAAAAISYITFIPAVLFLVLEPYNRDRFVRFHAWQCIALTIVAVAISILFTVLGVIGFHILWWLLLLINLAIRLILFVFWLIALIKASQGQWFKIPIVGDLATSISGGQQ